MQNGIPGVAILAGIWLSVRRVRRRGPDLVTLLLPCLVLATMAPFAFLHFESRYFVPLKLVAIVTPFVLVALYLSVAGDVLVYGSEPVLRQQQRHPWRSGFGHFGPNLARPSARLIQGGRSAVRPVKRAVAGVIILLGGLAVAASTSQLVNGNVDALSTVPPIEGMQAAAFRCLRSELAHEVPAGATILLIPPSGDNGVWIQRATEIAYPRN